MVTCEYIFNLRNIHPAVNILVYNYYGCQCTGTEAGYTLKTKIPVLCCASGFYIQFSLYLIQDAFTAANMACSTQTYLDRMFATGRKVKLGIERGNAEYLTLRDTCCSGYISYRLFG